LRTSESVKNAHGGTKNVYQKKNKREKIEKEQEGGEKGINQRKVKWVLRRTKILSSKQRINAKKRPRKNSGRQRARVSLKVKGNPPERMWDEGGIGGGVAGRGGGSLSNTTD